ncbi:titin-like, partial [Plakobranchus ocellatus]
PKFFTVQKRSRKTTVAKDPFSTDRQLNIPKGGTFQVKKSGRKATQFVEFGKGDRGWTAPKKFEVKAREKKPTQFWKPPPAKSTTDDERRRKKRRDGSDSPGRRQKARESSTDSGLGIGSGAEKDAEDGRTAVEADPTPTSGEDVEPPTDTSAQEADAAPEVSQKPKRREVVKKTRVERQVITPPQTPNRLPSPPPFKRRVTPPPTPPTPPESPKMQEAPLPELDLDLPTVPDLPDLVDKEPEKRKQKLKFTVEPPPPLIAQEAPKKRRAAPKVRIIPKNLSRPLKSRPAEAPVTSEEMQQIQDPLDFLAKYCIINPDRIPFYEIIFETTVADQNPRYSKPTTQDAQQDQQTEPPAVEEPNKTEGKKKSDSSKSRKSGKKSKSAEPKHDMRPGLFAADRGMYIDKPAMTLEEQHLEKLIYTLDLLQDKMTSLGSQLADLDVQRTRFIAARAKFLYPEVTAPDYFPKLKKKKGKKGKKENTSAPPARRLRPEEITDEVICARLDDKMLNEVCKDPELRKTEVAMDILKQKISEVQNRVENLASEKLLADAFCMNHYFWRQGLDSAANISGNGIFSGGSENNYNNLSKSEQFRRQQSELYNRLRPQPNFEMNLEEVEDALQQINNHLLTEKEFFFLYNILNLPRREKINFRLFSIIAALSEKVTQLE